MSGYDGDDFNDPILRCDDCGRLVHRVYIRKRGCCNNCGNRRFKNLQLIREEEWDSIKNKTYDFGVKEWNIDKAFLALFEKVKDVEE